MEKSSKIAVSSLVTETACPYGCPACREEEQERETRAGAALSDHDRQLEAILAAQELLFDEPDRCPRLWAPLVPAEHERRAA